MMAIRTIPSQILPRSPENSKKCNPFLNMKPPYGQPWVYIKKCPLQQIKITQFKERNIVKNGPENHMGTTMAQLCRLLLGHTIAYSKTCVEQCTKALVIIYSRFAADIVGVIPLRHLWIQRTHLHRLVQIQVAGVIIPRVVVDYCFECIVSALADRKS